MWHDKRYWYFITQQDMGQAMSLDPRTPRYKCDEEPTTKRICVAPTAANCMTAIGLGLGDVHIYRTRRQVKARKPYNVYDADITKEHWLMTRTRFVKVDVVEIVGSYEWMDVGNEKEQRKYKQALRSWCKRRDPRLAVQKHSNQLWEAESIKTNRRINAANCQS